MFLYTTLYLQQILGLSAIEAGLVYLPGTLVMLVVSGATAQLGAKVPARMMIARRPRPRRHRHGACSCRRRDSSWTVMLPGPARRLVGTGLFNPALTNVALGSVPREQSGLAAGVNDTFRQAGIAVGVAALGALIPAEARVRRRPRQPTSTACTTRCSSAASSPRSARSPADPDLQELRRGGRGPVEETTDRAPALRPAEAA